MSESLPERSSGFMPPRWIMHVDMDAFFASIEQMDDPRLRGLPIAIGGMTRGVIATASYEARRFGVHSAMPVSTALRLCPKLILLPSRIQRYVEVSHRVIDALGRFSPRVEQASIDEAYLDVTGLERLFGPVDELGRAVKNAVREATGGLSCSVGIAPVKFLAKIASDLRKPDGLTILPEAGVPAFLASLPVGKIPGVGKAFLKELADYGIVTCADVCQRPRSFWERRFGKAGTGLFLRAQGIDSREVVPYTPPKSESAETTFDVDTTDREWMKNWLYRHADRVGRALRRQRLKGRVVTLKVKYGDFTQVTRQTSLSEPTCATLTIYEEACRLLDALAPARPVRLVGLGVSGFDNAPGQGVLPFSLASHEEEERRTRLDRALDALGGKVTPGRLLGRQSKRK